ncbi:MucBP domain-containing protein [Enterococcus villorum]|uniref:MucBP domain-containing protein n=2 Tax=Enterococcus villorum TaxID=112904 RepID=A0A511J3F3_9ENTE|nr:MucBP domain-containing protein [Enterococcus villorum]EOH92010.1 hypothetical protein UAO_00681 [Enterococcus villorum ATCC 700913]EOW76726.1 hypothetical protein I591_02034 [Enterococcus villorum ATCC 700913]GEL92532.1 hypothetical protein EVI01_18690 [Enterococcus villorum]
MKKKRLFKILILFFLLISQPIEGFAVGLDTEDAAPIMENEQMEKETKGANRETIEESDLLQSENSFVISNYQFSPENSSSKPITSGSQIASINFNVTYTADNNNSIFVSIPGFLISSSSDVSVKSNVVSKAGISFNESPISSRGEWLITLERVSPSLQSGSVEIRFMIPKLANNLDVTGDISIKDTAINEYIRETVYVKTPKIINASGVQNSILYNRLSSGSQWEQGKDTFSNYEEGFIYSSTQSIGLIYGGDSSQNPSVISLSGPLIDSENRGYESEGVIVEDILPEGVELAAPADYGIPSGEMTENGFAIQITQLSLNNVGNYIDGVTKWGTSQVGLTETTNTNPEEGQVYIGKNEEGRIYFKANLGTIPNNEKWIFRYHQKLVDLPTTAIGYPEYINECFVSTKVMREQGKFAVHAGTWQTLQEEKIPTFYSADLKVDKELVKKNDSVHYTVNFANFGQVAIDAVIMVPLKINEHISNIQVSNASVTTQVIEDFLKITITQFPVNSKGTVSYAIDTADLDYGYQINQSFTVYSISGLGGTYQGNTVKTDILAEVEARYLDETDNKLSDPEILYGRVDTSYQTIEKQISDYELLEQPGNSTGLFQQERIQVIYRYRRSVGTITIQYLDQDGQEIMDSKSFKKSYGEPYEYFPEEIMGYQFTSAENDKGIVDQAEIEIKFHYQGLLYFKEVPEIISFGTHTLSKNTDVFFAEKFEHHLIVQDNRSPGNSWSIASRMSKGFTGLSGNQLKDSLYYLEEEKELLISDELNVIHSEESKNHDPIDLSEAWDEAHGLEMKVPAGAALAEEYSATVTWLLRDVPA